ncbi:hypothetical protein GCM10008022_19600 [Paenibacillus hunanensis]|nr:hypothetical protein GCM10008022_19600 [Paenibacillus hunanensis]
MNKGGDKLHKNLVYITENITFKNIKVEYIKEKIYCTQMKIGFLSLLNYY